jgi:hypothetical protein
MGGLLMVLCLFGRPEVISSLLLMYYISPHISLPHPALPHHTSTHLTLPHLASPRPASPRPASPYLTSHLPASPCLASRCPTSPCIASPSLTLPCLTSPLPGLNSPQLTSTSYSHRVLVLCTWLGCKGIVKIIGALGAK